MSYTIQPIFLSGYIRGNSFYLDLKASSVNSTVSNVGEVLQAVDGSIHYLHRAYKRAWDFQWEMIVYSGSGSYPLNTVVSLRSVFQAFDALDTDIVLNFENVKYNVIVEPNTWQAQLAANTISLTNVPYYNVAFRLIEV